MNHLVEIGFRNEAGELVAGELVNPFQIIESATSPVGLAIDIDQIRDGEIDVLVYVGDEPYFYRIDVATVVYADEVQL